MISGGHVQARLLFYLDSRSPIYPLRLDSRGKSCCDMFSELAMVFAVRPGSTRFTAFSLESTYRTLFHLGDQPSFRQNPTRLNHLLYRIPFSLASLPPVSTSSSFFLPALSPTP